MEMENWGLLLFKNTYKDLCFTVKESLISDIIYLLLVLMVFLKVIGMSKGILEHLPANSQLNIPKILLYISRMMQFRRMAQTMAGMRKEISFHIRIFKNI